MYDLSGVRDRGLEGGSGQVPGQRDALIPLCRGLAGCASSTAGARAKDSPWVGVSGSAGLATAKRAARMSCLRVFSPPCAKCWYSWTFYPSQRVAPDAGIARLLGALQLLLRSVDTPGEVEG